VKNDAFVKSHKAVLLSLFALVLMLTTACGGSRAEPPPPLPPPVPVTIETLEQHVGERVVVEGYLVAYSSISCESIKGRCWLWLTATPKGEDGPTYRAPEVGVGIYDRNPDSMYANTIRRIPVQWKPEDILVMGNNWEEIHLNDRVRVTGWVEKTEIGRVVITGPNPCADVPGGTERLEAIESHQCPETGFIIELLEK
jgi:hypothetical protein